MVFFPMHRGGVTHKGSRGDGSAGKAEHLFGHCWRERGRMWPTAMFTSSSMFAVLGREGNTYGLDEDQNSLERNGSGVELGVRARWGEGETPGEHLARSCRGWPAAEQLDGSQRAHQSSQEPAGWGETGPALTCRGARFTLAFLQRKRLQYKSRPCSVPEDPQRKTTLLFAALLMELL